MCGGAKLALPVEPGRRQGDLLQHEVAKAVEELVLVEDVVVDRHRRDAQAAGETSEAHRVEPLVIGDRERGRQDLLSRQAGAALPLHRCLARCNEFGIRRTYTPYTKSRTSKGHDMQSLTQRQKRLTLLAVSLAVFITTVDNTVV